jgi:hypothetical protein
MKKRPVQTARRPTLADILALEKETEGLLEQIIGRHAEGV